MTKQVEIIRKNEFIAVVLNADNKILVVHIVALLMLTIMLIYPFCKVQVTLLICTKISTKYFNFLDVFFLDSATELLEHTRINNY